MASYAAVVSLKQTIERLLNSSRISVLPHYNEILDFAYKEVLSFQEVLKGFDSRNRSQRVNGLDGEIREAVCNLEDALESCESNQILSQSEESFGDESHRPWTLDLQEVKQDIDSFTKKVNKLKKEYNTELSNPLSEEDDDDDDDVVVVSSRSGFCRNESKMIGFSDIFHQIKSALKQWPYEPESVSLFGMAGIGKTTVVKEVYENQSTKEFFDLRAWVTIGQNYQFNEVLKCILSQVNPGMDKIHTERDVRLPYLTRMISKSLKGKKYLIVLDDVWDVEVHQLIRLLLFRGHGVHCRILLTTRIQNVAFGYYYEMRFMNKEESWNLLRDKVFGEEFCPPQLEKAGKKIAENCDGLPLTIVTVASMLSKAEKTLEYWNKTAKKKNSVFNDAHAQMSKVLYPSYNYLSKPLKACFLYMGVFPENYEISRSKLIKLWSVEGIFEPNMDEPFSLDVNDILTVLVSESLLMAHQKSSIYGIKTCTLHSSFWQFCKLEARKNKFFHVLNSRVDGLAKEIENQRRLCIHNNIIFSIRDVPRSMASISTVRSLLCTGPFHQYSVPLCFDLRLLRVIDVLTIRFYEFPMELLKLVQLRYLALTYDGTLPPSISKLWNLQFLIVRRHLIIKSFGAPLYLPIEIWDMRELKHLQVMGSDLPDPCGALLPNLCTLLDVSPHSCSEGILKSIPKLKRLRIQIELAPDVAEPFMCFDHISHFHGVILKCVIVNTKLRYKVVSPPPPLSNFPSSIKKLTLSGFGCPWENMSVIASLPNLSVLKLRCYSFRGQKWITYENDKGFMRLEFLLVEDTDLVHWIIGRGSFPSLHCLSIKHCYKLEQIPRTLLSSLVRIEVVDCNPLVVTCAKQIKEDQLKRGNDILEVIIHSSWDEVDLKS